MAASTSQSLARNHTPSLPGITASPLNSPMPSNPGLSTSAKDAAFATLGINIQSAIPQEIRDKILRFSLSAALPRKRKTTEVYSTQEDLELERELTRGYAGDQEGNIWVDHEYKPPVALQINRELRKEYAVLYYGGYTINSKASHATGGRELWFSKWYLSLTEEHQTMIDRRMESRFNYGA